MDQCLAAVVHPSPVIAWLLVTRRIAAIFTVH
jgi:hypothetical protein